MSGAHVFVDESKRSGYVVAAASVPSGRIRVVEAELRAMLLPGQRSVHFKRESDGRRRTLLAAMGKLGVQTSVYVRASGPHVPARAACLRAVVEDHLDAEHLFLDLAEGDRAADERTLREARAKVSGTFRFHHEEPHRCAGLWIPDATAWAWAHGGTWRRLVNQMISDVRDV